MVNIVKRAWDNFVKLQTLIEKRKENQFIRFWMSYLKKFMAISIMIHEFSHLIALRIIGYEGHIKSSMLNGVYATDKHLMTWAQRNFYESAGGIGQVVYGVYNILFTSQEEQEIMVDVMIIIHGIIYGYCESFLNRGTWAIGWLVGFYAGWFFLAIYIWRENRRFFG